jgi:hypothetical protein
MSTDPLPEFVDVFISEVGYQSHLEHMFERIHRRVNELEHVLAALRAD